MAYRCVDLDRFNQLDTTLPLHAFVSLLHKILHKYTSSSSRRTILLHMRTMLSRDAFAPLILRSGLQGLIQKITKGTLPPLPSEYSADWKAVIKSMLRKIPEQRPSVSFQKSALLVNAWASRVLQGVCFCLSYVSEGLKCEGQSKRV